MITDAGITPQALDSKHWTLAILEDFKEKAWDIKLGRLKWVLRTAMPLRAGFQLFLNKDEVKSSKEDIPVVASFKVSELDKERWAALKKRTGENWEIKDKKVFSETFKSGITGEAMVTERTLPGKSDDILRSNGFFIRVRGRLIAQEEPFFGMNPLYHGTMNRLRADIEADDLDAIIKAPREEIEASPTRDKFEAFLREVFQEARNRWDNYQKSLAEKEERKRRRTARLLVAKSSSVRSPVQWSGPAE